jgi:hypothetical protein
VSAAFATLFLAHLIADYPLQPNWLVKAKQRWPGRCLHVAIHLAVLLVLCMPYMLTLWPYLLVLAIIHFVIDTFKVLLSAHRPQWIAAPYLIDQFIHLLSIWAIALWAETTLAGGWPFDRSWQLSAAAFLLATWVCYITELVLLHTNHQYQVELLRQKWTRMAARAIFLALLLWVEPLLANPAAMAGAVALLPYGTRSHSRRALVTDVSVTFLVAAMLWLAV